MSHSTDSSNDKRTDGEGAPTTAKPSDRPARSTPPLRREAVLMVHDRGRMALLSGLMTLAGVGLGFALAIASLARHSSCPADSSRVRLDGSAPFAAMPASTELGWLGVHVQTMPGFESGADGVGTTGQQEARVQTVPYVQQASRGPGGALVREVFAGTPAERAGIRSGAVIHRVNGIPITSSSALVRVIRSHQPGETVSIDLQQAGEARTVTTNLAGISPRQLNSRYR